MITIIKEPKARLFGWSQLSSPDMEPLNEFLKAEGFEADFLKEGVPEDADLIPEVAGRVCYMSYDNPRPKGDFESLNEAYIANIHATGHGSVLEHTSFNFLVSGVSRSLTHELVRHRVGVAYSQLSQRYVQHDGKFVMPWEIQQSSHHNQVTWIEVMQKAQDDYEYFGDTLEDQLNDQGLNKTERRKAARQAARSVLPSAAETKLVFSCNARELIHIFNLRGSKHADKEIRMLVVKLYSEVFEIAPSLFQNVSIDTSITPNGLKLK